MFNNKTRASLFGVAAAYMVYTAYDLFRGWNDPESTMPPVLLALFMVFFVLAAAGLGWYAYKVWQQPDKSDDDDQLK